MDTLTVSLELAAIKEQTRRLAMWSLVVHAAAVVLFLVSASQPRPDTGDDFVITEITWLEPEVEIAQAPEPVKIAVPEPKKEPAAVVVAKPEPRARPEMPAPDTSVAMLQQRLANLRDDSQARREITAAAQVTPTTRRPTPAATIGALTARQNRPTGQLVRAEAAPVTRLTELPKERPSVVAAAVTTLPEKQPEVKTARAEEIMPGVSLAGEVSGRNLLAYTTPEYPEWAKRDGVEFTVELYFTVLPSGQVKENVAIVRTSGFADIDNLARNALADWRFERLETGTAGDQWGRIEFKYRLRDAG